MCFPPSRVHQRKADLDWDSRASPSLGPRRTPKGRVIQVTPSRPESPFQVQVPYRLVFSTLWWDAAAEADGGKS